MSFIGWIIFFFVVQIIHFLGTWKLYEKAGRKSWEAAIPIYNAFVLTKIVSRPWWWVFILFIPVVNLVILVVLWIDLASSFGKRKTSDAILVVLTLGFYLYYLNYIEKPSFVGRQDQNKETFISSILFAVVAATIIRTFMIEAFVIPTSSMEKSLLVGDFLFVNKMSYGTRFPITPISVPLTHRELPVGNLKSYSNSVSIPYFRFPAIQEITNNDIVVFNYPGIGWGNTEQDNIDKRQHWVKRCVGIPGDIIEVKNTELFINGKKHILPDNALPQTSYFVKTTNGILDQKKLAQKFDITDPIINIDGKTKLLNLNQNNLTKLKELPNVLEITPFVKIQKEDNIFPKGKKWNSDNYGPLSIPKKGDIITLTKQNITQYQRIISKYENNSLQILDDKFVINGVETNTYTIKQDYYFMMGDNRHNSVDSRYWGYVPHDHVVGKPVFIWMSWNTHAKNLMDKIRLDRVMTLVSEKGSERTSYIIPALLIIGLFFGYDFFKGKLKKKKQ